MGWSRHDSRQKTLELPRAAPEPTREQLRAAYEFCITEADKIRLSFDQALAMPSIAATLKTVAKSAMLKRGHIR